MITRRTLLQISAAGIVAPFATFAANGAITSLTHANDPATMPDEAPGAMPNLIDLNALIGDLPAGIDVHAAGIDLIPRRQLLDHRLVESFRGNVFVALLTPASATLLSELLRFERGRTLVDLPHHALDPRLALITSARVVAVQNRR